MGTLRYHSRTLDLIGTTPDLSSEAAAGIAVVEKRIRRPLPASLREWYSLNGACDLLNHYSNCDQPVPLRDLGADGMFDGDLLEFKRENQCVVRWAVRLDGSDDPPVVVSYDDFKDLLPCTSTFSEHVYSCVWDWGSVLNLEPLIQAQNHVLTDGALSKLRERLQADLVSYGWPGHTQYRFFSSDQRLLIWASEEQADWWLAGKSEEALFRLARTVWGLDDVGQSFWSNDIAGETILQRARAVG